jgi:hypothetical protein
LERINRKICRNPQIASKLRVTFHEFDALLRDQLVVVLSDRKVGEKGEKTCSANLADTGRNERQAFKRQQFSAAKSEMACHNHFVLNSLGGKPKSAMSFPFF